MYSIVSKKMMRISKLVRDLEQASSSRFESIMPATS